MTAVDDDPKTLCQCIHCECIDCHCSASLQEAERHTQFAIRGMSCASCVSGIQSKLEKTQGILNVQINLLTESASISFNPNVISPASIKQLITEMGYTVPQEEYLTKTHLSIHGMTCASCVNGIEKGLRAQIPRGLFQVIISLVTHSGQFTHDSSIVSARQLADAIEEMGYDVTLEANVQDDPIARLSSLKTQQQSETRHSGIQFLLSLIFGIPAFIIAMILMHVPTTYDWFTSFKFGSSGQITLDTILMFILATPQQVWIGLEIHVSSYKSLRYTHRANMDTLISLGTWVAYLYSTITMIVLLVLPMPSQEGEFMPFFETSILLISFVLLGRWLDALGKGKAVDSLVSLVSLRPDTCLKLTSLPTSLDSVEKQEIKASVILPGDLLLILPGSRFPCDGVIVGGSTYVDTSAMTGEPVPIYSQQGDAVIGGTIVVGETYVIVRAEKVGAETLLSAIVRLVESSQDKTGVTLMVDKISNVFVPVILGLSLVTFAVWACVLTLAPPEFYMQAMHQNAFAQALSFAITTLVIACPCALGLATPLASLIGTGIAANNGILVRGGAGIMESARNVKVVILDKTGTITEGKMSVEAWVPVNDDVECLDIAATLESLSTHPIAKAIVAFRPFEAWKIQMSTEVAGKGISATVSLDEKVKQVHIGSDTWFNDLQIPLSHPTEGVATWIHVVIDSRHVGSYKITDAIRTDSRRAIEHLSRDKEVWMVTGDASATALHVATSVGIPPHRVIARADPVRKQQVVHALEADGKAVAFLGDGINDAAAITEATIGLSVGSGSDIALDSASVILLNSSVTSLCTFFDICDKTFKKIVMNLVWAFLFNIIMVPLAAGVLFVPTQGWMLPAAYAGLAMALSSVTVVVNSLLLRLYKPQAF